MATTLGQNFTINSLTLNGSGTSAVSIAPGGGTLTINAASGLGITSNAGAGTFTVTAPVILGANQTWTNSSGTTMTISGGVSGAANLTVNNAAAGGTTIATLSNTGNVTINNASTGGTTITTLANVGNVTVSDAGTGVTTITMLNNAGTFTRTATNATAFDTITGIGANVTAITQNNPNTTSSLIIQGTNTAYTGTTTLNAGRLDDQNTGTSNAIYAVGTGPIVLNGGTLDLRANGSSSYQGIITGNGTTGNNVTVGGTTQIDVQRIGGTNVNNLFVLNNLAMGGRTTS